MFPWRRFRRTALRATLAALLVFPLAPAGRGVAAIDQPAAATSLEPLSWTIQDLPFNFSDLRISELALDSQGRPHFAFFKSNYPLPSGVFAHAWLSGSVWLTETIASQYTLVGGIELALDQLDQPHLTYLATESDGNNQYLTRPKYAYRSGGGWMVQTVQAGVGSMVLDPVGRPHIAYFDLAGLNYAHLEGHNWITQTVDSQVISGSNVSLVLDALDRPHITYCVGHCGTCDRYCDGLPTPIVKYALWTGSEWLVQTVDIGIRPNGLTLDRLGRPHLVYLSPSSYYEPVRLKYAYWTGDNWEIATFGLAWSANMLLDGDDRPHIAYASGNCPYYGCFTDLAYTYQSPAGWTSRTLNGAHDQTGGGASLAIDPRGNIHIAYRASDYHGHHLHAEYAVGWTNPLAFELGPSHAVALEPGRQVTYSHILRNIGYLTDTYHLTWTSSQGWAVVSDGFGTPPTQPLTAILGPGQVFVFTVTVTIPTTPAVIGLFERTVINAASGLEPSLSHQIVDLTLVPRAQIFLPMIAR
jgi:hypothetical protein